MAASGWKHDVFLSFRGADTRNTFTGHLFHALDAKGINTFIDNQLERGHHISDSLVNVIEGSRIAIVIFSTDYAGSSSCLEELVKILECQKLRGQLVLPVFYNINPSDVEKQTGCYADSLAKLEAQSMENSEKMEEWRLALTEASTLSGWPLDYGNEAELIQIIVKEVSMKLNHVSLHVADYPLGLESHIQEMTNMLHFEMNEVQLVGIHGLGGIGKTTIAKAVFNIIAHKFEGDCFLSNVKETSEKKGLLQLQKTLFMEILRDERIIFGNCDAGITLIRQRLRGKRVLIVIDDVDELQQLKTLAGELSWFGPGSKIIITTRDEHLLKAHGVKRIYYVKELGRNYALELFSWNAFKKPQPDEDYLELSSLIIKYAQGLPLALVVLGSFLYGRSKSEWESQLLNLERNPNKKVNDILRISFDGLENFQKAIFLHIACFFKGQNKEHIMKILDACDLNTTIGVTILAEKSLIRIENNKFEMHDLVQAMGRQVVNDESPNICERSRLWNQDDILQVLSEGYMGQFETEALVVKLPHLEEISVEAFAKMRRLKILIVVGGRNISGSLENLPNDLRWLEWSRCPLESFPSTFRARKLVALKWQHSCIKELSASFKSFVNLKELNLGYCDFLTKTPDFSMITKLESLSLDNCTNLVEVHESVGYLNELKFLGLEFCCSLEILPSRFKLRSLSSLHLWGCKRLKMFPEIVEEMSCLEKINLRWTAIRCLPSSINNISGLKVLTLSGCEKFEMFPEIMEEMSRLEKIDLRESAVRFLPSSISNIIGLKVLTLWGCDIMSLPTSIKWLDNLSELRLSWCTKLQEIPELPLNIKLLEARHCYSLERYSQLPRVFAFNWKANSLVSFDFSNCHKLAKSQDTISVDCLQDQESRAKSPIEVVFPGSKITKWFNYIWDHKTSFSFELTSQAYEKLEALAVSAIVNSGVHLSCEVYVNSQTVLSYSKRFWEIDHVWLFYLPCCSFKKHATTANNDNVQFEVSISDCCSTGLLLKSSGVHLVYEQGENPDNAIGWSSMLDRQHENVDRTIGSVIEDSLVAVNNSDDSQTELMIDEHQLNQQSSLPLKPMDQMTLNPRKGRKKSRRLFTWFACC